MIMKMVNHLWKFLIILSVFFLSYAIASEAILHPESKMSWKLVYHVLRKAYWNMFGELFLEEVETDGSDQCTLCTENPDLYDSFDVLRCPSEIGRYFVPILMGVYVLIVNILMFNILIAQFNSLYNKVEKRATTLWSYQRFLMLREFAPRRIFLPLPFSFISILLWIASRCKGAGKGMGDPFLSSRELDMGFGLLETRLHEEGKTPSPRQTYVRESIEKLVKMEKEACDDMNLDKSTHLQSGELSYVLDGMYPVMVKLGELKEQLSKAVGLLEQLNQKEWAQTTNNYYNTTGKTNGSITKRLDGIEKAIVEFKTLRTCHCYAVWYDKKSNDLGGPGGHPLFYAVDNSLKDSVSPRVDRFRPEHWPHHHFATTLTAHPSSKGNDDAKKDPGFVLRVEKILKRERRKSAKL